MRLVVIESPYAGDIPANLAYGRACLRHSIQLGESPIASHLLYTQEGVLKDEDPAERRLGIDCGHEWMGVCDAIIVYTDRGISSGMKAGIASAKAHGRRVEFRKLPNYKESTSILPGSPEEKQAAWDNIKKAISDV